MYPTFLRALKLVTQNQGGCRAFGVFMGRHGNCHGVRHFVVHGVSWWFMGTAVGCPILWRCHGSGKKTRHGDAIVGVYG